MKWGLVHVHRGTCRQPSTAASSTLRLLVLMRLEVTYPWGRVTAPGPNLAGYVISTSTIKARATDAASPTLMAVTQFGQYQNLNGRKCQRSGCRGLKRNLQVPGPTIQLMTVVCFQRETGGRPCLSPRLVLCGQFCRQAGARWAQQYW